MSGIGGLVVRQVNLATRLARARFQLVQPGFEASAAAYLASLGPAAPAGVAYVNAVRPIVRAALQQAEAALANLDRFSPELEGAWRIPVSAVRCLSAARQAGQYADEHEMGKLVSNSSWQSPAANAFRQVVRQQTEATEQASDQAARFAAAHTAFGAAAVTATAVTVSQLALSVNVMANTQPILGNVLSAPAGAAALSGAAQLLNMKIMTATAAAKALASAAAAGFEATAPGS